MNRRNFLQGCGAGALAAATLGAPLLAALGDDTESLQAALDAAARAGRPLHLPAGRYVLRRPLACPDLPVEIVGAGPERTILQITQGPALQGAQLRLAGLRIESGRRVTRFGRGQAVGVAARA